MPFQGEAESTFGHLLPSLSEHRNTSLNRQAKKHIPDQQLSVIRHVPDENLTNELFHPSKNPMCRVAKMDFTLPKHHNLLKIYCIVVKEMNNLCFHFSSTV